MTTPNTPKLRVFVASSRENLHLANAIQSNIHRDVDVTLWTQAIFSPSRYVLESLEAVKTFDAGIFVLAPDDVAIIRGAKKRIARDNVIFELGLFAGALGRKRTYLVIPRGSDLHLPSDLLGLVPAEYDPNRFDRNWTAALGPACTDIVRSLSVSNTESRNLSLDDIETTGLFTEYTPIFDGLIRNATTIVLAFIHSRRWRENHVDSIREFLKKQEARLTVYLPEPGDQLLHQMFKRNFDDGPQIPAFIKDACRFFGELKREHPKKVTICCYKSYPTYSFYILDNKIVFAMYPTTRRRKPVPTFVVSRQSRFGTFVSDDLQQLQAAGRKMSLKELTLLTNVEVDKHAKGKSRQRKRQK